MDMEPQPPKKPRTTRKESPDLSGQVLGDYRLLRRLGEGGMGQVYLAEQMSLRRRVALKLLRSELANHEVSLKRFEAEAKAVAQLTHPNIVQVYTFGEHGGMRFMALEYIDGRNLREFLNKKGPPELPIALSIMRQGAQALIKAAELGIIHRDIKPENILLTRKGEVKVTDFGLSRICGDQDAPLNLTQTGVTMGTPLYMSPEQVEGKGLDPRTDIYSFGVTCYHLLSGQPPFEGENAFAVALQHVQKEPVPLAGLRPDLPPELCAIVAKMMAKNPEHRYQTPRDILRDLKRVGSILQGAKTGPLIAMQPVPSVPDTLSLELVASPRKKRVLPWVVAATLVLALLIGGMAGAYWRSRSEAEENPWEPPPELREVTILWNAQDDEAFLTRRIRTNTGRTADDLRKGIGDRLDLAVLLFKQREQNPEALARAEKFFQEQSQSTVEPYRLIGEIGEAMVLAFQDKPAPSLERFLKVQEQIAKQPRLTPTLRDRQEFQRQILRALEYNEKNAKSEGLKWPEEMTKLRQQLLAPAPAGGRKE